MILDINNVNEQILQELITNKVFENKELEYKDYSFSGGKLSDKSKDKFMKEVAAFANTNGGIIVIGMQEDDNRLPATLSGAGLTISDYDNWLSSFRQLVLSRIRPHLHGVECKPVELECGDIAIIISIPKSIARPHSFWDGNKDEFFIRYANGITYMDIDDLKKGFLFLLSLQNQIQQFKKDRISMILSNECIGNINNKAKLVLHIIPEWSFELGNYIDITNISRDSNFRPISGNGWDYRYNADGFYMYSNNYETHNVDTYAQLFHNGIIEATEIRLISGFKENLMFDLKEVQGAIIKAVSRYEYILQKHNIPKPWHIFITILNAKGYKTTWDHFNGSEIIDRNIVATKSGIWKDNMNIDIAIKPVLDSMSNAFGFDKSYCYDQEGKIKYQ